MSIPSRREFLALAAGSGLALGAGHPMAGLSIGVTDWNLRKTGNPEAVELARRLGFDGVEVSLGRRAADGRLPMAEESLRSQYLAEFLKHKIRIAGTCLDILHVNYLKNDKLGRKWVADGIGITKALGARVMLLPFFGKGALQTAGEKEYVGDVLRELAPEAGQAGVTLGLEDTISAEDNVRIMDRARSRAVLVYYDVGNSTLNGFDVAKEIRWLGRSRICQFHLKDNPGYLGEGKIDFQEVIRAIASLGGFEGFANLETSTPKSVEEDMRRNLAFVRGLVKGLGG